MCINYLGFAQKATIHQNQLTIRGIRLGCNSWNCPECGQRKAIVLGNRVRSGFDGERVRLMTLTTAGRHSLRRHIEILKSSWNRLRLWLSRHCGLKKFFWVLEFGGKNGRPHLHILINVFVKQSLLSTVAKRCGFGPIVDIREVKTGGGFGYVFKYLKKDMGSTAGAASLKGAHSRRFGCSRSIPPLRGNWSDSVCIDLLKDAFATEASDELNGAIAGILTKSITSYKKAGAQVERTGELRFDVEGTKTILALIKMGAISRGDILGAGGWQSHPSGPNHLAAVQTRLGLLKTADIPF